MELLIEQKHYLTKRVMITVCTKLIIYPPMPIYADYQTVGRQLSDNVEIVGAQLKLLCLADHLVQRQKWFVSSVGRSFNLPRSSERITALKPPRATTRKTISLIFPCR